LAAANLTNSVGDGLFAAIGVVYLVRVVGLSSGQVVVGLAIGSAVALLAGIPVGVVADRVGAQRVYLVLLGAEGLAVAAYALVGGVTSFVVVAALAVTANRSTAGVRNGFIAQIAPLGARMRMRAYLRSVTNVGTALGAGLAGLALIHPVRSVPTAVLFADTLTFLLTAAIITRIARPPRSASPSSSESPWTVLRSGHFLLASTSQAMLSLNALLLTLTLPLWIITRTIAPPATIGALLVGSTVGAVTLQLPMSRVAATTSGASRSSWIAGLLIAGGCAVFSFTTDTTIRATVALLAIGAVLRLVGDLLQAAGGWAMSFAAPPPGWACTYQATYSTAFTAAGVIGPLMSGWVVTREGGLGWLAAGGFFAVFGATAALSGAVVMNRRSRTTQQSGTQRPTGGPG
jgi:MFS transporter